jgi:hypothetical protein
VAGSEPVSTVEYRVNESGFGGAYDLHINGQSVAGVQEVTVEHRTQDYAVVTLRLGGVRVKVTPDVG